MLRNALNNLTGALVPAFVMFFTVPIFVKGLGHDGYGLFVIVTSITGYMAVLDINVSAGATKFIAEARALGNERRIDEVVGFSTAFNLGIGLAGAALMFFWAPELMRWLGGGAPDGTSVGTVVLRVAALGFLLGQIYNLGLSLPQALERYDLSARVEIGNGVIVPSLSAAAVSMGAGLIGVMWLRNGLAVMSVGLLFWLVRHMLPQMRLAWPGQLLRHQLLSFSAFAYLSRLAALSYQHADKLIIASMLDVRQVAYYAIPVMLSGRIMGMTYRLTQVIFPRSSGLMAQGETQKVKIMMLYNMRYVMALNTIAVVMMALLGHWFLSLWLGREFAERGTVVLVLIAGSAWMDSLTNAPAIVTEGAGRPKVTGLFSISRAAIGLIGLYFGASLGGIEGVAAAHLLVSAIASLAFLAYFRHRMFRVQVSELLGIALWPSCLLVLLGGVVGGGAWFALRSVTALAAPLGALISGMVLLTCAWRVVLLPEHKERLLALYARRVG